MSYYLKTFDSALMELARSLRADLGSNLDLVRGGILRSLIEAVAFQVADLSERQESSILAAVPEAVYAAFGFARLEAARATGTLTFTTPIPAGDVLYVPAGTEAISDDDTVFLTTVDGYIAPGQTSVTVPAIAEVGGQLGNVQAYSVIRLGTGLPGIQSVSNPAPMAGGTDGESPDDQRARFVSYLFSLDMSNRLGLTACALAATADNTRARNVLVRDNKDDLSIAPGTFQVHAYRRGGLGTVAGAIVKAVEDHRSGGTFPIHTQTPGTAVSVTLGVNASDPAALSAVEAAVGLYFDALGYGQKVSYENLIFEATAAHPSITEVKLTSPAADVPAGPTERLELGLLSVTAGSA